VELEKRQLGLGGHALAQDAQVMDYPSINLNPR